MSPLNVEIFVPEKEKWAKVGQLNPGDPPGSVSQNKPAGQREVYLFQCEGDESAIYRSELGIDAATPQERVVNTVGLEEVVRLREGESHTLSIKTDVSDVRRVVRFTHHNSS